jgi:hypothetical protein
MSGGYRWKMVVPTRSDFYLQKRPIFGGGGVLMPMSEDNSTGQRFLAAFRRGLQELGWAEGRSVQIEMRRASGDAERTRRYAEELVALAPDGWDRC